MNAAPLFRRIGPVAAGLLSNVALTLAGDMALSALGVLPPFGSGYSSAPLLSLALSYRTLFAGVGGFLTARLASVAATCHVAWLMAIGLVLGVASAIGGRAMFPMWYLLAIVALSVPATAIGAALQTRARPPRAAAA